VIGAEEADWLLCDAYRKWRLLRAAPPIESFAIPPRGMILSEGAGAVLLAREGDLILDAVHPGRNFRRQSELVRELEIICGELPAANGFDLCLRVPMELSSTRPKARWRQNIFRRRRFTLRNRHLGESVAAGTFWQLICAAQALRQQKLPPLLHQPHSSLTNQRHPDARQWRRAIITACGLNQQVAACTLRL
jgi:hypothetical protein